MTAIWRRLCPALLLTMAAPLAAADAPPPDWQGVWAGTVGTLPVRACLSRHEVGGTVGAYFYLSRLRTIGLVQVGDSRVWSEGFARANRSLPRWTFYTIGRDRLTGIWSDGRRAMPFLLSRLASEDDTQACGTDAFNAPRWRPLRVTRSRGVRDGVPYLKLAYRAPAFPDTIFDGFAMIGSDAATRRINAALRAAVPGSDDEWRGCIAGGLDAHGADGDSQATLEPTMITARWLVAALSTADECGGAHPNSSDTSLTFDRASGAQVRLETWLTDTAIARRLEDGSALFAMRPALRSLVLARARTLESDCREAVADQEFWDLGLDRRGLTFAPDLPHASQSCMAATLVPWIALAPYLNALGRAGRDSLTR